jgi:hypothetical protein
VHTAVNYETRLRDVKLSGVGSGARPGTAISVEGLFFAAHSMTGRRSGSIWSRRKGASAMLSPRVCTLALELDDSFVRLHRMQDVAWPPALSAAYSSARLDAAARRFFCLADSRLMCGATTTRANHIGRAWRRDDPHRSNSSHCSAIPVSFRPAAERERPYAHRQGVSCRSAPWHFRPMRLTVSIWMVGKKLVHVPMPERIDRLY